MDKSDSLVELLFWVVLSCVVWVVWGWAVWILWDWYSLSSIFPLTLRQAIGLRLTLTLLVPSSRTSRHSGWTLIFIKVLTPIVILGVAWLLRWVLIIAHVM